MTKTSLIWLMVNALSTVITHAGIADGVGRAFSRICLSVSVCLSVCALTGK